MYLYRVNNHNEFEIITNPDLPIEKLEWGRSFYKIANQVNVDGYFLPELQRDLGFRKFVYIYLPRQWGMLMGWVIKKKWFPDLQIHFDEETVINRLKNSHFQNKVEVNGKSNSQKFNVKVMPLKENVVKGFESLGEYFYQILELCVVCYNSPSFKYKYPNNSSNVSSQKDRSKISNNSSLHNSQNQYFYHSAEDLFFQVVMETKQAQLYAFLYRSYPHLFSDPHSQMNEGQEKEENKNNKIQRKYPYYSLIKKHQNQIIKEECSKISGDLRRLNNPYDEEFEPHIFRLMEHSIMLSEQDHGFKMKYYNPFLNSMEWMNRVKKEGTKSNSRGRKRQSKGIGVTIWAEGDYLYYSKGKGKAKYILC